ncbi:MAG: site-specific DNA-methyltransferase [Chitinispirillales bacterium]|nr:site-specific DNA-methyltransferase [Chitinispirillales bacterium]
MEAKNLRFEDIKIDPEWHFKNVRSIERFTHGYHRYPAKFLPDLVKKLIEEHTKLNDTIADVFAGCGTTLVEAKLHGRKSIGVDINPVAELITKVKTNPIKPTILQKQFDRLTDRFSQFNLNSYSKISKHERIDYWFVPENKNKIAFLYDNILKIRNKSVKGFFLVSLSHILKNCSRWLQSSTKPQVDPKKPLIDPFSAFNYHTKQMIKKNKEFYGYLEEKDFLDTRCEIKLEDARKTSIAAGSVAAIITSPPYVTSYEYADIHQLTAYWYEYVTDLASFRRNFIGTFYSQNQSLKCHSMQAQKIVDQLFSKDGRVAKEVANYFKNMQNVAEEMYRILCNNGHVCVVIGNTTLRNVKIESAEVFVELLEQTGFKIKDVIKRSIPNKLIPTIRDKTTGKFVKLNSANSKLVYPEEYILIARKREI